MKRFALLLRSIVLAAALFLVICALNDVGAAFTKGEGHAYYIGSSSSQAAVYESARALPAGLVFSCVGGESAYMCGAERTALEEEYSATLLFEEKAGDTVNYYYYSPLFHTFIYINGFAVNLHIAVRGEKLCIGTPIIFGGY